ncbi:hypothetical protein [Parafilimonas sp.]|uniref:hypothetical protein n=1 Tax=Parafilimonas sp. TaxID=1969739 RepID=UPI0039E2F4AE
MTELNISHKDFLKITKDYSHAAAVAHLVLVYVTDKEQGIIRLKKGKGFSYLFKNDVLKSKQQLERIRKLVLPPAWKNVWICYKENGHLQATGYDARSRKQYRYHALWNALRNETKFHRMHEFGKVLPRLRLKAEEERIGM